MARLFALSIAFCFVAQGATKPLVVCLKAYSDRETAAQAKACPALADTLNQMGNSDVSFSGRCVTGPEVFNRVGCGVYDVAIEGQVSLPAGAALVPVRKCVKAYSDRETLVAKAQCDQLAQSLANAETDSFRFEVACTTGPDAFNRLGCGVYDAALNGQLVVK